MNDYEKNESRDSKSNQRDPSFLSNLPLFQKIELSVKIFDNFENNTETEKRFCKRKFYIERKRRKYCEIKKNIYNFPRSSRIVKENIQNAKFTKALNLASWNYTANWYEFLRGPRLNRARLNGQSNDKCISYATMSPADSRKIENKSCGDLHSRMRLARNNVLRGCIRSCHCAGSKFLVQRSSGGEGEENDI